MGGRRGAAGNSPRTSSRRCNLGPAGVHGGGKELRERGRRSPGAPAPVRRGGGYLSPRTSRFCGVTGPGPCQPAPASSTSQLLCRCASSFSELIHINAPGRRPVENPKPRNFPALTFSISLFLAPSSLQDYFFSLLPIYFFPAVILSVHSSFSPFSPCLPFPPATSKSFL